LFFSAAKIFVPVHFRKRNGELLSFGSGFPPLKISVKIKVNMRIILVPQNNSLTQLGLVEQERIFILYILLTVHLDAILGNDQLDALFLNVLIYASTCFEQQVLIIRRAIVY
jgi:hypothetical protein